MLAIQFIGTFLLCSGAIYSIISLINRNVSNGKIELLDEMLKNGEIDSTTYLKYKNK